MDFDKAKEINGFEQFIWYDMAVGLRANTLSYLFVSAKNENLLNEKEYDLFYRTLLRHAQYLYDDKRITFHTNHGLFQVVGQGMMAQRLYDYDEIFKKSYHQSLKRLKVMYENQFSKNGIHKEHSPGYYKFVFDTFKVANDAYLIKNIDFKKMEQNLYWFYMPDGKLVNFGDTAKGSINVEFKFDETYKNFKDDGYFIVRHPNNDNKEFDSYLAQISAFNSTVHKHADNLSFVWHDFGQNILIDSGTYAYSGINKVGSPLFNQGFNYSNPNRIYIEKTLAHNALQIDDTDHPRVPAEIEPYISAIKKGGKYEDIYATTSSFKMRDVVQTRLLIFNPAKWLIVVDKFEDVNKKPHEVKQWFHIGPELKLVKNGNEFIIKNKNVDLKVKDLLGNSKPSSVIFGQEKPYKQGWYSIASMELRPNYAFNYNQKSDSGIIATLFENQKIDNLDVKMSKIKNGFVVESKDYKIQISDKLLVKKVERI